jgi:hypothetical protein
MPIKYYPATQIRTNLYTRGTDFVLPNGKPYSGRYYEIYDGTAYAGANPVFGTNEPLTPISEANTPLTAPANVTSYITAQTQGVSKTLPPSDTTLTELAPYYPVVIPSDYQQGYFIRYFAKNVTGPQFIIEISQTDYTQIQNGNVSPNVLGYESTSMLWQLTGPLHDTRISQYQIQGGVYDTNKRVTEAKQTGFNGIVSFIGGDYIKYAKITP